MAEKDIKVLIATHKPYEMPKGSIFLPIEVGADLREKHFLKTRDNDGKNISKKNLNFCELTAIYWAWKNLDADYVGLTHYRRQFINPETIPELLKDNDIILPKLRKYYIENLYDHYIHTMEAEPLDETRKIIKEKYPDYLPEFDKLKTRTSAHMFNMFVMEKSVFNDYCKWLFDILFELEKRIDIEKYNAFQARFFGRVSELLLDVYLNTNNLSYTELKVKDIEGVNWFKKGWSFLAAKLFGRKYDKSF